MVSLIQLTGPALRLPKTDFYFFLNRGVYWSVVPCFAGTEIALLETWAQYKKMSFVSCLSIDVDSNKNKVCVLDPNIIRTAAEFAVKHKLKLSKGSSLSLRRYDIKATCRKILKPLDQKKSHELLQDQIRKGNI